MSWWSIGNWECVFAYLPILGVTIEHGGILLLVDLVVIIFLDVLDLLFGLDAIILREGTGVTLL